MNHVNIENDTVTIPWYAVHKDGLIAGFFGPFRFLSNFYVLDEPSIHYCGLYYPSVEHAYQAAKWPADQREQFLEVSSGKAKRLGKEAPSFNVRHWQLHKYSVMRELCWQKFSNNDKMKKMLLATDGYKLEERNSWGDQDWGTNEKGEGENHLGIILMDIRERLINPDNEF